MIRTRRFHFKEMSMALSWRDAGARGTSAWLPQLQLIITIILICSERSVSTQCPSECDCYLKDDLPIAKCSTTDLSVLGGLPSDVAELNLGGNKLGIITPTDLPYSETVQRLALMNCKLKAVSLGPSGLVKLKYLDLTDNELIHFPTGLPSTLKSLQLTKNKLSSITADEFIDVTILQELFLDKNQLRIINSDTFTYKSATTEYRETPQNGVLMHLQKLALNNNKIESISANAFYNLKDLFALNLANNKISTIQNLTFTGLRNLQHLDLSRNKISSIEDGSFEKLKELKYLRLKHNRLTSVPQGLPMLEWLDLSYNHIKQLSDAFIPVFYTVEVLNLGQNPFHCDCHLLWLKEFYDRREYLVKHLEIDPYEFVPTCASPETVLGESWDVLSDDMFTCDVTANNDNGDSQISFDISHFKVLVSEISDTFIHVDWSVNGTPPAPTIVIQYYEFGHRAKSIKHLELAIIQRGYTLKHLKPETNYVICVTPKSKEIDDISNVSPLSMDHCVEVTTIRVQTIHILSYFWIFCYYILASAGTILFLLIFIGAVALIGSIFMKGTDWSSKYVAIDEPIREEDESPENTNQTTSPKQVDDQGKLHND